MSATRIEPVRENSLLSLLLLQLLGLIAAITLPSLWFGAAVWALPAGALGAVLALGAGYAISSALVAWRARKGQAGFLLALPGMLALGFLPAVSYLLLTQSDLPRRTLSVAVAIAVALTCVAAFARPARALRITVLAIAAAVGLLGQIAYLGGILPRVATPSVVVDRINTDLYALTVTEYRSLVPKPQAFGGAIARIADRHVLATGDGDLYLFSERPVGQPLNITHLSYRIPLNAAAFLASVGTTVDTMMFRAADIAIRESNGHFQLFASHHYWKVAEKCFVERVSELEGLVADLLDDHAGMTWKTIYESSPCVPIAFAGRLPYFNGAQAGGRFAFLTDNDLLVTIGDNGLDGWSVPLSAPQDMSSSYGKTILIHLGDLSHETFSSGHRNPQGLVTDGSGTIWLTEHGPQGGDELDRIERGGNYGWPVVTYGSEYSTHTWPFDKVPGSHEGYLEPFYSWVPSIGVSSLLVSNSPQFASWKGDLLVSSLKDRSIHRMRIRQNRVVMVERFPIGRRIRDIEQGQAGELLLWTDSATLMVVRAGNDSDTGEALFDACVGCHAIGNGHTQGFGPDLYKIVNRNIGSADGFHYSPAMQALAGNWTRSRLDAFLADPQAFVPGTSMQFNGLSDPTSRAKLIDMLASGRTRALGQTVIPE